MYDIALLMGSLPVPVFGTYPSFTVDNQVYFITARCRDRFPAFASDDAKRIFWDRFTHYAAQFRFTPWVTSLLDNHYHTVGYMAIGRNLGTMMQRVHGSTAKLVNDLLPQRRPRFWADAKDHGYFDGCLRDLRQGRLTYRYVLTQAQRHGVERDFRRYPHTRVNMEMEQALAEAVRLHAFLVGVPYRRYEGRGGAHGR